MINLSDTDSIRAFGKQLEANHEPPYNVEVVKIASQLLDFLCVDIPEDPGLVISFAQNRLMNILQSHREPLWKNLSNAYFSGNKKRVISLLQDLGFTISKDPMHQASVLFMRIGHNPLR